MRPSAPAFPVSPEAPIVDDLESIIALDRVILEAERRLWLEKFEEFRRSIVLHRISP